MLRPHCTPAIETEVCRPTVTLSTGRIERLRRWLLPLTAVAVLALGCSSAADPTPAAQQPAPVVATPAAPLAPTTPAVADGGLSAPPVAVSDGGLPPVIPTPPPGTTPLAVNDAFFASQLQAAGAPGAAMAIVKHGTLLWSKGFGYADLSQQRPSTPDTLFMLASISKTFGATALLQLAENSPAGLAILDQDVNAGSSLPFLVRNPRFPNSPITYRMLLTHTSSLIDGPYFQNFDWSLGDSQVPLANFLAEYMQDLQNWSTSPPGAEYSYSNAGASLIGHIVERATNMNLQTYSQSYIFGPIGMTESSWFLTGLDPNHIAMPYVVQNGSYQGTGQYGFADYPDGQLRTSAAQLARFLIMLSGDGSFSGVRLLKPSTIAEMRRSQLGPQFDYQGLILFSATRSGVAMLGHNGATLGGSTDMWFDPVTTSGYVLLTNGDAYLDGTDGQANAMTAINDELGRLAMGAP